MSTILTEVQCEEADDGVRWLDKKKAAQYPTAKLEKSKEPTPGLKEKEMERGAAPNANVCMEKRPFHSSTCSDAK